MQPTLSSPCRAAAQFNRQVGVSLSDDLSEFILQQRFAPLAKASLGQRGALPVKGGAQKVQMLTGVIVIEDTDRMGKVQARQLPHPNGSVPQKDHDLGLGHTAANGFGA